MKRKIEEILGVYYVAPHVSMNGKTYKQARYRCGDCFCGIQKIHTHSNNVEYVQPLLELFKKSVPKPEKEST